ncbi:MAG: hypothetical protein IH609_19730 [Dehalococcoidia bacterium]|nr:hypothetical protein [Dehalococcoidia bacterium]
MIQLLHADLDEVAEGGAGLGPCRVLHSIAAESNGICYLSDAVVDTGSTRE